MERNIIPHGMDIRFKMFEDISIMICPLFCLRAMNAFLTKKHNPTIKNHIKPHKRLDIHKKPHYNNIKVG